GRDPAPVGIPLRSGRAGLRASHGGNGRETNPTAVSGPTRSPGHGRWIEDAAGSPRRRGRLSPPLPLNVTSLYACAAAISSRARQRTALNGPADVYEEEDDERAHKEVARTARRHDGGPGDDHSWQRGRRRWPLHRRFGFRPGARRQRIG